MQWSTTSTFLLAFVVSAGTTRTVTACSCFPGFNTVEQSLATNAIAVRTFLLDEAAASTPDDDINGYKYIPSYVFQVYQGCDIKDLLWIRTAKNEGLCGVPLDPFTPNLLFGSMSEEDVPGYGTQQVMRVSLCEAHSKMSELSLGDRMALEQMDPPDCGVDCRSDIDCNRAAGEYCAAGECLAGGECQTDDDCYNPSNRPEGSFIQCLATQACDVATGTCTLECCQQPAQCFADPCDVTECNEAYVSCVADSCNGGCGARFFAADGTVVCQA